jgi:uncharacterized protein (UPF0332 family)
VAKQLHSPAGDEARLRSAISRAYYGCFNETKSWLASHGVTIPKDDVHTFVWSTIGGFGNDGRRAKYQGRALRIRRNIADYDAPATAAWDSEAADAFQKSETISILLAGMP